MAEGLLKAALDQGDDISVVSAGVAAMPGQPASRETATILKKKEASIEGFKSRQLEEKLAQTADLIIALSSSHADVIRHLLPSVGDKINLLTDFIDPEEGLVDSDVPDPYGMSREAYEEVAEVIELAIPGILRALEKQG